MTTSLNSKVFWFLFLVVTVLTGIRTTLAPQSFADFASYVELVGQLKSSDTLEVFALEPLSKLWLYSTASLVAEHGAVTIVSYLNTLIFAVLFCRLVIRKERNVTALILLVGLYVPLMAFVALRAMPAYLIVALAVEKIWEKNTKAGVGLCLLASMFHFSALLILVPLLLSGLRKHKNASDDISPQRRAFLALLVFLASAIITFGVPKFFGNFSDGLISSESMLSRYSAYLMAENAGSSSHLVYFYFVSAIVGIFMFQAKNSQERIFAASSMLLFSVLSISPVAAYRYSLYFVIPILLNFRSSPASYTYTRAYASFVLFTISLAFFFVGMWQALQVD